MSEYYDDRITEEVLESENEYDVMSGNPISAAINKLGYLEDLIDSGEIVNPSIKIGEAVYFVYKESVVLDGKIENIYNQYDGSDDKWLYYVVIHNEFYNFYVSYLSADFGNIFFKNETEANKKLEELKSETTVN